MVDIQKSQCEQDKEVQLYRFAIIVMKKDVVSNPQLRFPQSHKLLSLLSALALHASMSTYWTLWQTNEFYVSFGLIPACLGALMEFPWVAAM